MLYLLNSLLWVILLCGPSLVVYGSLVIGRRIGGNVGMRICDAFAMLLGSAPFLGIAISHVQLIARGGSLVPQYGDQFLGLILLGFTGIAVVAALVTLRLAWQRQIAAIEP